MNLNLNLESISGTVTPLAGSANESFVTAFWKNTFGKVGTWLADAGNGIASIFADTIHVKNQLCIGNTCINETQLQGLLKNSTTPPPSTPSTPPPATPTTP